LHRLDSLRHVTGLFFTGSEKRVYKREKERVVALLETKSHSSI